MVLLLVAGFALVASRPESYDFPLRRDAQKTMESVTSVMGSDETVTGSPIAPLKTGATNSVDAAQQPLPPSVRIQVPFLVQAPTGNWDMPFQEACEEVSILMVHHYLDGSPVPKGAAAEKAITDLVEWEVSELSYSADIDAEKAARIAKDYWGHRGQVLYDFTIDDMKRLLAEGHPIIVPLAGRDVGNPYYSGEGPWYHMLVVTGYDGNQFITNDPGTRRGEGYRYPQQRLYNAIHDWTGHKEGIRQGRKVMILLES